MLDWLLSVARAYHPTPLQLFAGFCVLIVIAFVLVDVFGAWWDRRRAKKDAAVSSTWLLQQKQNEREEYHGVTWQVKHLDKPNRQQFRVVKGKPDVWAMDGER